MPLNNSSMADDKMTKHKSKLDLSGNGAATLCVVVATHLLSSLKTHSHCLMLQQGRLVYWICLSVQSGADSWWSVSRRGCQSYNWGSLTARGLGSGKGKVVGDGGWHDLKGKKKKGQGYVQKNHKVGKSRCTSGCVCVCVETNVLLVSGSFCS